MYMSQVKHKTCFFIPRRTNVFGNILESPSLSVCPSLSILVSVCVQNNSFCQSAGEGSKSHLVTSVVYFLAAVVLNFYEQILRILTSLEFCFFSSQHFLVMIAFSFNPFPNKPWFLRVYHTNLLKTQREKEKLLVTSNFSFSHGVFYHFGEFCTIFIQPKIVVCKPFQFRRV